MMTTTRTDGTLVPVALDVDRAMIRAYADITADYNPIHIDPEFAARSPMGGIIAHGTMSANLIFQSVEATFGAAASKGMTLDVRFLKPVREGDRVEAGGQRDPEAAHRFKVWVRNQDGVDVIAGTADVPAAR